MGPLYWATTEEDVKKSVKSIILARENVRKKLLTHIRPGMSRRS